MNRLNVVLLLVLLGSCLLLVKVSYESRRNFALLDRARADERRLAADHERLSAERHAQATSIRVESVAREKLGMRNAAPAITQYVQDSASAAASGGAR